MSTVAVIGAGYVGTTTAACLAWLGHDVTCADIDADRVRRLAGGDVPLVEDHLADLVATGLATGRLRFVTDAAEAAAAAEFVFLCVPTPSGPGGAADLTAVDTVCRRIARRLRPGAVVVNKSTMPVGSVRHVTAVLAEAGAAAGAYGVASNPEFLREGRAVRNFLEPDRIVIGADHPGTADRVRALYREIDAPVVITDPESAEMTKYAANAYLATRVTFVNAIAALCERVGADVLDVVTGMGHDRRIGSGFLAPGPGYGGSCLPKDVAALVHVAEQAGADADVLRAVMRTNARQRDRVIDKVARLVGGRLDGAVVAVWGLTFKAGTDDVRDSPALDIADRLLDAGAVVRAFDPAGAASAALLVPGLDVVADAYLACKEADVLLVLTEWDAFRDLDFGRVHQMMAVPRVVDTRNVLDPHPLRALGFTYEGTGRR